MTTLIASLSAGKGTWIHVGKLIDSGDFDKVILVTNQWGKDNYKNEKNAELIVIDAYKPVEENMKILEEALKDKIDDTEVAVNFISGSGNEHMSILSTLLKLGLGIRLVIADEEGKVKVI